MGLDAVVYMGRARIEATFGVRVADMDAETGELLRVQSGEVPKRSSIKACSERIGNISAVAHLRELLIARGMAKSRIVRQVLYSGAHSGDHIELGQLPDLRRELSEIPIGWDASVDEFVAQMNRLVAAAESEGNPIVFV